MFVVMHFAFFQNKKLGEKRELVCTYEEQFQNTNQTERKKQVIK
jgi:hypothetical protein